MKYSFLLLIVCVFFWSCDPIVKEGEPQRETFSLGKLYKKISGFDSAAKMLQFKPDTGAFKFSQSILDEFYPDTIHALKGNVASIIMTELSPGDRGKINEDYTVEYLFENGRLVKLTENKPDDTTIQIMEFNASGLLSEWRSVYPSENDSVTLEYQYDSLNRLSKILRFDGLNVLVQTSYFFYNKNRTLDSMFYDNTEGDSYSHKYFTNNSSGSYLKVKIHKDGTIQSADFYLLNDNQRTTYDEHYYDDGRVSIGYNTYRYDTSGLMTEMKVKNKRQFTDVTVTNSYRKKDAAGNWIEMFSYVNRNLSGVHRRSIKYK